MTKFVEAGAIELNGKLVTLYKKMDIEMPEEHEERHRRCEQPKNEKHYKYYKEPLKDRSVSWYRRNRYWLIPAVGSALIGVAIKGAFGFMHDARNGYLESGDTVITDPDYTIR